MVDPPSPGAAPGQPPRTPGTHDLSASSDRADATGAADVPGGPVIPSAKDDPNDVIPARAAADRTHEPAPDPRDVSGSPGPVSLFGDPPDDPVAGAAVTDYEGIGSASRSCLVILLLATAIVVLVCVSTVIRAVT